MASKVRKEMIKKLKSSLAHDEWEFTTHRACCKGNGVSLWIANGWMFLEIDPGPSLGLSLIEKLVLWQHMKRARDAFYLRKMSPKASAAPNEVERRYDEAVKDATK